MIEQIYQLYGYLHGMWRYRWSALVVAWSVALIGLVVVLKMPSVYEAKAVFHLDTKSIMTPLLKGLAVENEESTADSQVMTRILLSRENMLNVIRENDMDLGVNSQAELDKLAAQLAEEIKITGGAKKKWEVSSNIYEISYQGDSAERVYRVVSSLLNTFIENTLNAGRTDTASAEAFLDKQIADYEQRLITAEQKLAAFKKENVGLMPDESGGYYMRLQRAESEAEATKTAIRLADKKLSELRRQLKGEKPVYSTAGDTAQDKLAEYKEELDTLLTKYTDQHPDVIALQDKIANYQAQSSANASADSSQLATNPVYQELKIEESKAKVELETLRLTLSDQEAQIAKLRAAIDSIPEVEAELSRLNRDYNITRDRYLELVDRRESAQLAREAEQSTSSVKFRIIDPPIIPSHPSGPNRVLYSAAVFALALLVGLGWGLLRYLMHPTFIGVKQLKENFAFPVLGSVGLYLSHEGKRKRHIQLVGFAGSIAMLALLIVLVLIYNNQAIGLVDLMIPVKFI